MGVIPLIRAVFFLLAFSIFVLVLTAILHIISVHVVHNMISHRQKRVPLGVVTQGGVRYADQPFQTWQRGLVTEVMPAVSTNCSALVAQDQNAIRTVQAELRHWESTESEEDFYHKVANCTLVREDFDILYYVSDEEHQFPLAFVMIVHSRPQQVYRLLRAIYRPHNLYCIHPDAKSDSSFIKMFHHISHCLHNVIGPTRLNSVMWGGISVLDAQLNCMQELLQFSLSWKYVINICGLELPLRTNREIVQALKPLNGSSAVIGYPIPQKLYRQRFTFEYNEKFVKRTRRRLAPPPHKITIYKGLTYHALTRQFVTFLFNNHKAKSFHKYLAKVLSPEEEFYASLYYLPEAPGGRATISKPQLIPRVDNCIWNTNPNKILCSSMSFVRKVCVVKSADLHSVYQLGYETHEFSMFFNKYYHEEDHVVMDCLERRLVMQNMQEYANDHLLEDF